MCTLVATGDGGVGWRLIDGHIALGVDDVYQAGEDVKARGGNVVREAGPMNRYTARATAPTDADRASFVPTRVSRKKGVEVG